MERSPLLLVSKHFADVFQRAFFMLLRASLPVSARWRRRSVLRGVAAYVLFFFEEQATSGCCFQPRTAVDAFSLSRGTCAAASVVTGVATPRGRGRSRRLGDAAGDLQSSAGRGARTVGEGGEGPADADGDHRAPPSVGFQGKHMYEVFFFFSCYGNLGSIGASRRTGAVFCFMVLL